jgi:hypothetical protein
VRRAGFRLRGVICRHCYFIVQVLVSGFRRSRFSISFYSIHVPLLPCNQCPKYNVISQLVFLKAEQTREAMEGGKKGFSLDS